MKGMQKSAPKNPAAKSRLFSVVRSRYNPTEGRFVHVDTVKLTKSAAYGVFKLSASVTRLALQRSAYEKHNVLPEVGFDRIELRSKTGKLIDSFQNSRRERNKLASRLGLQIAYKVRVASEPKAPLTPTVTPLHAALIAEFGEAKTNLMMIAFGKMNAAVEASK